MKPLTAVGLLCTLVLHGAASGQSKDFTTSGKTTTGSDGTVYTTHGRATVGSDGSVCTTTEHYTHCSK
jgi:hypothetical protein